MNILITISEDLKGPESHESVISEVIFYHYIDQAEATFITYSKKGCSTKGIVKLNSKSSFLLRLLSKLGVMEEGCTLESERPGFKPQL